MRPEQKAFKEWLGTVNLNDYKIENLKDCIYFIFVQGYEKGQMSLLADTLDACDFCNKRLLELQDQNLELLAELAAKNMKKPD